MGIVRLPGTKLTPTVLLAQALEDAGGLDSVTIISKFKSGHISVSWSRQDLQEVAYAIRVLDDRLRYEMNPPDESEIEDAS